MRENSSRNGSPADAAGIEILPNSYCGGALSAVTPVFARQTRSTAADRTRRIANLPERLSSTRPGFCIPEYAPILEKTGANRNSAGESPVAPGIGWFAAQANVSYSKRSPHVPAPSEPIEP